ncbi:MAG: VOC family protein [Polyangiales bacterium]
MTHPHLHHVALRTRDVAALTHFYRSLLGLTIVREQAGYSVWLSLGDAVLMIERRADGEPEIPAGSMELTAFSVTSEGRDRVREWLRARGVAIESETAFTTYFRDPDGRRVGVSTYALPHAGG